MKSIVITGVSTGIGYATTKVLISKGYQIFGSVRNKDDAKKLEEDFPDYNSDFWFKHNNAVEVKKLSNNCGFD